MVKMIKKKSSDNFIRNNISDFTLFTFLGIFTLIIGITFYLASKPQEIRQRAFGPTTEFGFNTDVSAVNSSLDINRFKANIDTLSANGQKWVRININDAEIAQEAPGAQIQLVTPTPIQLPPTSTPPPTVDTVKGLSASPIQWNTANLSVYDQAVDYALSHGLKIFLVTSTPIFAKNYTLDDYKTLTDQYFNYLSARYTGKIAVWQIFNNANVSGYTDSLPLTSLDSTYLSNLTSVIGVARNAIKTNDPNALVTTNAGGIPLNDTLTASWNQYFDALSNNLDIISVGMYPNTDTVEISKLSNIIESLKTRYGKDVVVSDTGMCTQQGVYTESDQQNYVTQAVNNIKLSSVKLVLQYEIMDQDTASGTCNGSYGILKTDGSQKTSYPAVISSMQPLPTPTPTPLPTNTPAPTPTDTPIPTPTPIPITMGILNVAIIPPISASIKVVSSSNNKVVINAQGGINGVPLNTGNYYVAFSYPKTAGLRTPKTTYFKIYSRRTTQITGDFTLGKTTVVYK